MKLLQTITDFNNNNDNYPVTIEKCRLFFDFDKVRALLKLDLSFKSNNIKNIYIDVCCYDKEGFAVSIIKRVLYKKGEQIVLPSFMTSSASVILRAVDFADGTSLTYEEEFPKKIDATEISGDAFSDTARFNSLEIAEQEMRKISRQKKKSLRNERLAKEEEIRNLIKTDPIERKKRTVVRLVCFTAIIAVLVAGIFAFRYKTESDAVYNKASNLYNSGKFEEAIPLLESASQYLRLGEERQELLWKLAMAYSRQRDFHNAALNFAEIPEYSESFANYRSIAKAYLGIISAGDGHTLGLCTDGTVVAAGDNSYGQCEVENWSGIVKVSAGKEHSAALKDDKTVVAVGSNEYGQCDVGKWKNITDISAGSLHTVGVESDGDVIAVGDNEYGQCDVESFEDVVLVSAGATHTVGLKLDGTVIATGSNKKGECNVSDWRDVISVSAGNGFTAGLTADGRILVTGDNSHGIYDAEKIKDALFITAGDYNIIAVLKNGHTIPVGSNNNNQGTLNIWKGIVSADGGGRHSVGICKDGTAVGAGDNKKGQISISDWERIGIPKNTVTIRKGK